MAQAPPPDGDLRLRYLDWCSAKVAARFQELSVDEIWERGQLSAPENPGYLELVRLLSVELADELELPSFAEWSEAYLLDPAAFHREMMGFGARGPAEEPTR